VYHELEMPGTVFAYSPEDTARGNAHKIAKPLSGYDGDAQACVDYLRQLPYCTGKIGTAGMCLGGHLAFRAALLPHIRAAACLYPTDIHKASLGLGQADDSLARCGEIQAELLMRCGRQDPQIPQAGRALIYQRLSDTERTFTWHEFNAEHAFMRDVGHRYNPQLTLTCYDLMVSLFQRTLATSA
jgi:carboxymethylenebutenolidase